MEKVKMLFVVAVLGVGVCQAANLQTVFFDDFSGDLSQWNSSYLQANNAYINASGQLVLDSASVSNQRGFFLTNYVLPSTQNIAATAGLGANEVGLSVSFDVISATSVHAGGFLFGAAVTPDGKAGGTKMYDAFCGDADGINAAYLWYGGDSGLTYYGDAGPNALLDGQAWNNGTGNPNTGHTVRIDWLKNSGGLDFLDHGIIYIDGVAATGSYIRQSDAPSGALGFYLLLDRDAVIDNFKVSMVVPEPATLVMLGLGAFAALRRKQK